MTNAAAKTNIIEATAYSPCLLWASVKTIEKDVLYLLCRSSAKHLHARTDAQLNQMGGTGEFLHESTAHSQSGHRILLPIRGGDERHTCTKGNQRVRGDTKKRKPAFYPTWNSPVRRAPEQDHKQAPSSLCL